MEIKKETLLLIQKIAVAILSSAIVTLLWFFLPGVAGKDALSYVLAAVATLLLIGYNIFFFKRKTADKTRTARALILLVAALAILIYYNFF